MSRLQAVTATPLIRSVAFLDRVGGQWRKSPTCCGYIPFLYCGWPQSFWKRQTRGNDERLSEVRVVWTQPCRLGSHMTDERTHWQSCKKSNRRGYDFFFHPFFRIFALLKEQNGVNKWLAWKNSGEIERSQGQRSF